MTGSPGFAGCGERPPARLNVVLMQPEIPQNAGNVARTCACTGAALHLVHPMGFQLTERNIRRSGMDYLEHVELVQWPSTGRFLEAHGAGPLFLFTASAELSLADADFRAGAPETPLFLVFGRESAGIDPEVLGRYPDRCVRIPMHAGRRSLNLANSVAIGLYEALRQLGYPGLG